ncbi:serine/threonine-protein kinase [Streptomyces olivaceoviridis]|uniref:serine/threonine-protein kinase n=1 Tax=Streptomyces olivaceoviridis TaxID=1921 RepID=UPI0037035D0C
MLGEGGMGTVWRAHDEVLHREVAVKEVRVSLDLPAERSKRMHVRLEREAWAAARVNARAVVTVYDVVTFDDRPWIVMELVRGRSLADVIGVEGALPPKEVARIGTEVLAALRAAHAAGVLHRDVKPANVLLADEGRVVLTDFGIATVEGDTALTMTGEVVGSPEYLAPERALGRTPGTASDLWSLGALLYTAVQGRSPFRRTTALATLRAIVDDDLPPAHRAGPLVPVIEGLLLKDPEERMPADEAGRRLRLAAGDAAVSPETETSTDATAATTAAVATTSATGGITAAVTAAVTTAEEVPTAAVASTASSAPAPGVAAGPVPLGSAESDIEILLDRMRAIRDRFATRLPGLPDDEELRAHLSPLAPATLRTLQVSGAWDTLIVGGEEADIDIFYQNDAPVFVPAVPAVPAAPAVPAVPAAPVAPAAPAAPVAPAVPAAPVAADPLPDPRTSGIFDPA